MVYIYPATEGIKKTILSGIKRFLIPLEITPRIFNSPEYICSRPISILTRANQHRATWQALMHFLMNTVTDVSVFQKWWMD